MGLNFIMYGESVMEMEHSGQWKVLISEGLSVCSREKLHAWDGELQLLRITGHLWSIKSAGTDVRDRETIERCLLFGEVFRDEGRCSTAYRSGGQSLGFAPARCPARDEDRTRKPSVGIFQLTREQQGSTKDVLLRVEQRMPTKKGTLVKGGNGCHLNLQGSVQDFLQRAQLKGSTMGICQGANCYNRNHEGPWNFVKG
jgi:hypothetical protein